MNNTSIKESTTINGFSAASWRETMGPGHQAVTMGRTVQRQLGGDGESPAAPTRVRVPARQPGWNWLRRIRDWARYHPGYASSPSQQALDVTRRIAGDSQR